MVDEHFADACDSLKVTHPEETERIDAWLKRYDEMLGGAITGTVEILAEMRSSGITLYALSNWSTETFPIALSRFECLKWFQGVLLSGEVRLLKPDRRIFEVFFKTFAIDPARAIYIDDRKVNVEVAASFGMHGILIYGLSIASQSADEGGVNCWIKLPIRGPDAPSVLRFWRTSFLVLGRKF